MDVKMSGEIAHDVGLLIQEQIRQSVFESIDRFIREFLREDQLKKA